MKKFLIGGLIGLILGGGLGFAVAIFVYPFIFQSDIVASEQLDNAAQRSLVATGHFIHADPDDPLHHGTGGVSVYTDAVKLEQDFEVGPGPKFHVYLSVLDDVTPDTKVEESEFVDLGQLRAFKGSQVFPIPDNVELSKYRHVIIWCKAFSVLVSPARLNRESGT